MPEAVIVATARSPIGRANKGSLVDLRPDDMAAQIIDALLDQGAAGRPGRRRRPDDGHAASRQVRRASTSPAWSPCWPGSTTSPASPSTATARRACRPSAWPPTRSRPARATVHRRRRRDASAATRRAPRHRAQPVFEPMPASARSSAPGRPAVVDAADGLPDIYIAMGQTAENVRRARGREPRGDGRVRRALPAAGRGQRRERLLRAGDHPADAADGTVVSTDDGPRPGTTLESLGQLKPVFRPDGEITAGNACPLNDGAAAVIVMSDTKAKELGLTPLARIVASAASPASTPRSWASVRSRPAGRRWPAPA